jgi:NH3-dependent NAD+ synthetase
VAKFESDTLYFTPDAFSSRFLDATPTAELEPITENYVQADEADMGMSYEGKC